MKLTLQAKPTFSADVGIQVAGEEKPVKVRMTFKHRTRTELAKFVQERDGKVDAETFLDMVVGWELEDQLTRENVELLLENYGGAAVATYRAYFDELMAARRGN
jgi:Ca2+-binding EF-hand superfamily protein